MATLHEANLGLIVEHDPQQIHDPYGVASPDEHWVAFIPGHPAQQYCYAATSHDAVLNFYAMMVDGCVNDGPMPGGIGQSVP
ncbi:MAG: hypothetical protein KGI71_05445 [Patescibacteria group bacterium]|nr:hypothetical protein [Patescibacteria group bacterium]